jgi:hypothetical protein
MLKQYTILILMAGLLSACGESDADKIRQEQIDIIKETQYNVIRQEQAKIMKEAQENVSREAQEYQRSLIQAAQNANCLADLNCSSSRFKQSAEQQCGSILEDKARTAAKWDYQIGSGSGSQYAGLLDRAAWVNEQKDIIGYYGNQVKFQNGFGAWMRINYECIFNIKTNNVTSARFLIDQSPD